MSVAVEIEIDPLIARTALCAAHHPAVKCAGGGQIINWEGKVERGQGHVGLL